MAKRYPLPNPYGWFHVGNSADLPAGRAATLRLLGEDYLLVRSDGGKPNCLGAYCPHQGARIDKPMRFDGSSFTCPFHGWQFDVRGACTKIPYSSKIPRGACLSSLPIAEKEGMIFAWWHSEGEDPLFDLPAFLDRDDRWGPWQFGFQREVNCHVQEFGEQAADGPHFPAVHGFLSYEVETFEMLAHELHAKFSAEVPSHNGVLCGEIENKMCGLTLLYIRISGFADVDMFQAYRPVSEESLTLRCWFSHPKGPDVTRDRQAKNLQMQKILEKATDDDVMVFEHKRYYESPLLTEGEDTITTYRKWADQFYLDVSVAQSP